MPYIISLDHHTDTHPGFTRHAFWTSNQNVEKTEILRDSLIADIDKHYHESLMKAATYLWNDEHIDASIRSGGISHSFSIQYSDGSRTLSIEENAYISD